MKTLLNNAFKERQHVYPNLPTGKYAAGVKSLYADYDAMVKFDQMWLFFNMVSPAVHTLLPSVLQRLDSSGIEALILILEKVLNCRYDLIIGPILRSHVLGFFQFGD